MLVRVLDQAAGNAAATRLTSRLALARLALRARWWFPERWSEDGGLLELWLSWARRTSSSWMRSRSCSIRGLLHNQRTQQPFTLLDGAFRRTA